MRDLLKSIAISTVAFLIICIFLKTYLKPSHEDEKTEFAKSADNVAVKYLITALNKDEILRKPYFSNKDLTSSEIIKVIFDNLSDNDYKLKLVKPQKVACYIDNIEFYSQSDCTIRVVNNDIIKEYERRIFNISSELVFNDFDYKGESCKNNGINYYCIIKDYTNNIKNYSYIKDSYIQNNKLYIEEYYLSIDQTDKIECFKYYGRNYCDNPDTEPVLDNSKIIEYGVLYRHVYGITKDGDYYLEKSYILDV